ncbi:MAG: hypothetical protein MHM6MM_001522 [Cercozoa sp. M6MM]
MEFESIAALELGDVYSESGGQLWTLDWHPRGELIACAGASRKIDLIARRPVFNDAPERWTKVATLDGVHDGTIRTVAWSPCGRYLASCSFDGTTAIWQHVDACEEGDYGGVFRADEFECVAQLEGHKSEVKCVAWSPCGTLLATCSRDHTILLWEVEDDEVDCLAVLEGHSQDVKSVLFLSTGMLLSTSYDGSFRVWRCADEDSARDEWYQHQTLQVPESDKATVWSAAKSRDDAESVAVCDAKGRVAVCTWQLSPSTGDRHLKVTTSLPVSQRELFSLDFNGQGALLCSGADDALRVLRPLDSDNALLAEQACAHAQDINCARFSPVSDDVVASCGDDGFLRIWRLQPHQQ